MTWMSWFGATHSYDFGAQLPFLAVIPEYNRLIRAARIRTVGWHGDWIIRG